MVIHYNPMECLSEDDARLIVERLWPGSAYTETLSLGVWMLEATGPDRSIKYPYARAMNQPEIESARKWLVQMVMEHVLRNHG